VYFARNVIKNLLAKLPQASRVCTKIFNFYQSHREQLNRAEKNVRQRRASEAKISLWRQYFAIFSVTLLVTAH